MVYMPDRQTDKKAEQRLSMFNYSISHGFVRFIHTCSIFSSVRESPQINLLNSLSKRSSGSTAAIRGRISKDLRVAKRGKRQQTRKPRCTLRCRVITESTRRERSRCQRSSAHSVIVLDIHQLTS